MKIAKFGGSSLANATQFKKVKEIIERDSERKYIVVSAPGKGIHEPNKITDLLYLLNAHRIYHADGFSTYKLIEDRFLSIKKELDLKVNIEDELEDLYHDLDRYDQNDIVSRGEYFCAKLMADYLGYTFVDAKDYMIFDGNKKINYEKSCEKIRSVLPSYENFVFPGFYGADHSGRIQLFPRGGSDITGSILAKAMSADLYENWTDVSGFRMADPQIVLDPKGIDSITYTELRELSYMGADVLHNEAVFPVKEAGIPLVVLNTNAPDEKGTLIVENCDYHSPYDITGIAGRKGFVSINFFKQHMSEEIGYLRKILSVFEEYGIPVEHLPSGIDTFSVIVKQKAIEDNEYELLAKIKKELSPDHIEVRKNLALISTVGQKMSSKPGTSGRLFFALGKNNVNIAMICQGADEINITVGVDEKDFEKTIQVIYHTFVEE